MSKEKVDRLHGVAQAPAVTNDLKEQIAINLWHRFAPEGHMEWSEERHAAEYRDAADAVLFLARSAQPTQAPAVTNDRWPKEIRSLVNEIAGIWDAFEIGLRQEISNTNYACVREKLTAVETLLATPALPQAPAPTKTREDQQEPRPRFDLIPRERYKGPY